MTARSLHVLDVEHARFNALKTVSTDVASAFENQRFGALHATRDSARLDGYYNRILGLTAESLQDLDEAIEWIQLDASADGEIRVEIVAGAGCEAALNSRGFSHADSLVWLSAERSSDADGKGAARPLSVQDWPAMRLLLEQHGPIADDTWREKRSHLCTNTFRWFGIFEEELLISAASVWIHHDAAIFGSALTLPDHRNQGHQSALLKIRRRLSPETQYVDVAPGSISYRNCIRAGFQDHESRTIWTRHSPNSRFRRGR